MPTAGRHFFMDMPVRCKNRAGVCGCICLRQGRGLLAELRLRGFRRYGFSFVLSPCQRFKEALYSLPLCDMFSRQRKNARASGDDSAGLCRVP